MTRGDAGAGRVQILAIGMPRAGMAQSLAPNFSFKHGRQQSTKLSYRPVGNSADRNFFLQPDDLSVSHELHETTAGSAAKENLSNL
jgi:hypothetical protein